VREYLKEDGEEVAQVLLHELVHELDLGHRVEVEVLDGLALHQQRQEVGVVIDRLLQRLVLEPCVVADTQ
jgi:hypothetical protein